MVNAATWAVDKAFKLVVLKPVICVLVKPFTWSVVRAVTSVVVNEFSCATDNTPICVVLKPLSWVVPMLATDYFYRAILIPLVIMSMAALGVNILVGYCGQISLGSGAFMAVGAYAAYNFFVRIEGMPLILALIMGGFCAMVFGMVPLAFALSEGSEQRAPMGQAVIGGVITSSLLTLVVVPVVYCYLDDLAEWMKRKWSSGSDSPAR